MDPNHVRARGPLGVILGAALGLGGCVVGEPPSDRQFWSPESTADEALVYQCFAEDNSGLAELNIYVANPEDCKTITPQLAKHDDGSMVVTGSFHRTIKIVGATLTAETETDLFVARYCLDRRCNWARRFSAYTPFVPYIKQHAFPDVAKFGEGTSTRGLRIMLAPDAADGAPTVVVGGEYFTGSNSVCFVAEFPFAPLSPGRGAPLADFIDTSADQDCAVHGLEVDSDGKPKLQYTISATAP